MLFARKFSEETGVPSTTKQEKKMARILKKAIEHNLVNVSKLMDYDHRIALDEDFLPVSEIVKETGIKLPKKLNDMLGDTARGAITYELKDALEKYNHPTHIEYVKKCILSALKISEKTGISLTNDENAKIEEIVKHIIQTELAKLPKWIARKDYNSAAYSMLPVLEIAKRREISLTNEENTRIKEIAPKMIQADLEQALMNLEQYDDAENSLSKVRRALKIAEETKTDLTEGQKKMIEDFAQKIIQANLEDVLSWDGPVAIGLPLNDLHRVLKFAEKTKTDLTKKQKKMIEDFASGRIQHELVHASRNADIGKSTDAALRLLYAFKIAEETGTHFTEKQAEMAARILMRLDKNFRGFIALSS